MLSLIVGGLHGASVNSTAIASGVALVLLLVPLGAYWWSVRLTDWVLNLAAWVWTTMRHLRPRLNPSLQPENNLWEP